MANTKNLGLYKVNPATDGNLNFNIKTMISDPLDKIDEQFDPDPAKGHEHDGVDSPKVKAANVPVVDADENFTGDDVEEILSEIGTHMKNTVDPSSSNTARNKHVSNKDIKDINEAILAINTKIANYNSYASNKDANGIYTVVDYKRANGTLYMKSTLSNPDSNGNYQTNVWQIYNDAGTTVIQTITWVITYDADGGIVNRVVV